MAVVIRLIVVSILNWIAEQTPTFIAWWQKQQALTAAKAQHDKNQNDIDAAFAPDPVAESWVGGLPAGPAAVRPQSSVVSSPPAASPAVPGSESSRP